MFYLLTLQHFVNYYILYLLKNILFLTEKKTPFANNLFVAPLKSAFCHNNTMHINISNVFDLNALYVTFCTTELWPRPFLPLLCLNKIDT